MSPRFDMSAAPVPVAELGSVHVLAVGGAGMSAVARLLAAAGVPVSGSDAKDSEVLRALRAEGIRTVVGHDPAHLRGADTVVVSSAIREDNVELAAARAGGLRVLHRAQALACLLVGRQGMAVAGANGKTTTSAMLAAALVGAGADPSYAIGGELVDSGTNAHVGAGELFVVEADESDGSFLVYHPQVAVVTNVQPDHLDFYGTFEAVQEAYAAFADTIRPGGLLVTCVDDPGAARLAARTAAAGREVLTYGRSEAAQLRIRDLSLDGLASRAVLDWQGSSFDLVVPAPGVHNVLNAAAAFGAATAGAGQDPAGVLSGLASFAGVRRRFEAVGEAAGVRVVDDYAHNPGKVAALVTAAAAIARPGRLIVVFQPHLYSRTRDFAAAFGAALGPADVVVVMDVYAAREDPIVGVTGALVADAVPVRDGLSVEYLPGAEEVVARVAQIAAPGDLVVTVGAGDVTQVGRSLVEVLRAR